MAFPKLLIKSELLLCVAIHRQSCRIVKSLFLLNLLTDLFTINAGVTQGPVLAPTLCIFHSKISYSQLLALLTVMHMRISSIQLAKRLQWMQTPFTRATRCAFYQFWTHPELTQGHKLYYDLCGKNNLFLFRSRKYFSSSNLFRFYILE